MEETLETITDRLITEMLWHLNNGATLVHFGALVENDEEITIADLLYAIEKRLDSTI